jgi:hypothetical protein
METKKPLSLLSRFDYVTVLIIMFFVILTIGVFVYFKSRIDAINAQQRQSSYQLVVPGKQALVDATRKARA